MSAELYEVINDFIETLMDLASNISILAPGTIISDNITRINDFMKNLKEEDKKKVMEIFVTNVYSNYKKIIYDRNDTFFLNRPKSELVDTITNNVGDKINGYESYIDKIFDLKDVWVKLSKENQNVIFDYLIILCELSESYIEIEYPELLKN